MLGGGAAVCIGSLLPWISVHVFDSNVSDSNFYTALPVGNSIRGDARAGAAVFGLVLLALAITMLSRATRGVSSRARAYAYGIPLIVLSVAGFLGCGILTLAGSAGFREAHGLKIVGYGIFTLSGARGISGPDGTAGSAHVSFVPNVGLIMILLGCVAAGVGGISSLRHAARIRDRNGMTTHDADPEGPPGPQDSLSEPPPTAGLELDAHGVRGMNMNPGLDERGIAREARPPRKWLGYLLAGICLASGIGQLYWAVSIASTQMVGVYHQWNHENWVPLSPGLVAIFVSVGVGLWLVNEHDKEQDKYSQTERRVLYTALILAVALGVLSWIIISQIEPYQDFAPTAAGR